eukprot:XP_011670072.1 PREDICTED: FK506-binding protein 5 [Strongylocentrotus purpuratus]
MWDPSKMSGAADDDSAPSNSTPQTPEGTEGAPDVTVTESKPDTPGSHANEDDASKNDASKEESKSETPIELATEDVEPAKRENDEPANEEQTEKKTESDTGDETAKVEEPTKVEEPQPADGEGAVNASEESPSNVEEERKCEPAPETGETDCVKQDDAEPLGEVNEAQPNENEKGDSVEGKQAEEPAEKPVKEEGETEGVVATDDSAKDEGNADEVGSVDKNKSESESENVIEAVTDESINTKDNNDVAEGTAQNADAEIPTNIPESANEPVPTESVEDTQCAEENPQSNKDDVAAIVSTSTGDAPSNPEERTERAKVEISELDSVKLENERLKKRVKELEDEIDRIREGRKEGMKVQADYLARELSQTQDTEKYLREKLAEVLQEKEDSERRVKDMQLRLKRFAKDDQAKDARLAKMQKELREITHEVQILENMLDADTLRSVQEQRASGKVNGPSGAGTGTNKGTAQPPPPQSKTWIEASNSENVANEPVPTESVEDTQCAEENPQSNKDDVAAIVSTSTGDAPSNPEERTERAKVEISELDSVKLENERLKKRVKELEDEIDRIREGRKEGMKVQADYLARELSQTQDTEKYLREKLAEVLQEKEDSERRVKDMQLRLKRFAKDDQAKDARYDEARALKCNDVSIYDDYISLNIAKSKTDQYRQGNSVVISAGVTEACPVKMVKKYIRVARISLDSNHFFFKPAYRSKGFSALIRKEKPLSYTTARGAGGATMVANTSTKAKDGYVVDTLDNKLEVTKSLML